MGTEQVHGNCILGKRVGAFSSCATEASLTMEPDRVCGLPHTPGSCRRLVCQSAMGRVSHRTGRGAKVALCPGAFVFCWPGSQGRSDVVTSSGSSFRGLA